MNDADPAAAEILAGCDFDMSDPNFLKSDDGPVNTDAGLASDKEDLFDSTFKLNGSSSEQNTTFYPEKLESFDYGDPLTGVLPSGDDGSVATAEASSDYQNPPGELESEASNQENEVLESLSTEASTENKIESSEVINLDTTDVEIVEEGTGSGLTPDDYYYQQLNPDELTYFNDHKANHDMRCLVCSKQVSSFNSLFRHPFLSISTCSKCCNFLLRDGWTKDDAGCDQECRWCGQGGNILLCDNCPSSFCEGCVFKNLGRKYMKEAKTSDNWKCLMCDPTPILKLRADHYEIYKLKVAGRSKKKQSEKPTTVPETEEKFDEEIAKKFLEGVFKIDLDETFDTLKQAVQEEKEYCYQNIGNLNIETLKTSVKNLRKIFLNFEGYFNSERSRLAKVFNRSFPNHKITTNIVTKVEEKEEEKEKKVVKKQPKKKKVQVKIQRKSSAPLVKLKNFTTKKLPEKKPGPARKKALPAKKKPTPKGKSTVGPRKRAASPPVEAPSAKSARGSRRNRSASPPPDEEVTSPSRGRRSGANGKGKSREIVSSSSSSRSPSPTPVQSKPFVTPATKKAFPEASRPIIPNLSGFLTQFSSDASDTKPKPKVGPKSRIQKAESSTDSSSETPPKRKIGPKSKIGRDN